MTRDEGRVLDVADLLGFDVDIAVDGRHHTTVSLPNGFSSRLRELLEAAAAPGHADELAGEASIRQAFEQVSEKWRQRAPRRVRRRVAIVAAGTAFSLIGVTTGLAAAQVPNPAVKIVRSLLGSPSTGALRPGTVTASSTSTSTSAPSAALAPGAVPSAPSRCGNHAGRRAATGGIVGGRR